MDRDDGGPAFPATWVNETEALRQVGDQLVPPGSQLVCLGISVRDYFASQAAAALTVDYTLAEVLTGRPRPDIYVSNPLPEQVLDVAAWYDEARARMAYARADAMLKARKA